MEGARRLAGSLRRVAFCLQGHGRQQQQQPVSGCGTGTLLTGIAVSESQTAGQALLRGGEKIDACTGGIGFFVPANVRSGGLRKDVVSQLGVLPRGSVTPLYGQREGICLGVEMVSSVDVDAGRWPSFGLSADACLASSRGGLLKPLQLWEPGCGGEQMEASSVKRKRKKKMNKHKQRKLRRRDKKRN